MDSNTAEIVQNAVSLARSGDVTRAYEVAKQGLLAGGEAVTLHAFMGMVKARSGDLDMAANHLRQAYRGRPDDVTIACNLISVLIDAGDMGGALDAASAALAFSDQSLRVARYRGFAAQSLELYDQAVEAYEHVVERAPDDFASWNNLGNARIGLGDHAAAVAALERAMALDSSAPPTRLNLAAALKSDGRWDEAEKVLRQAAEDFSDDARPVQELYVLLKQDGRHDEALPVIERAVARDPNDPGLQLKLGIENGIARRSAEAERAFRRVIELDPLLSDAYLGLIIQYEHSNREDEFAPLIALAESNGVDEGVLNFMRALELRRAGQFEESLVCLDSVPETVEPERTIHLRATLLDRLGRSDAAFAAFAQANAMHRENPTEPVSRAVKLRDELEEEIGVLTPEWVARWTSVNSLRERPDPVFLVGFPRSGTTLLDTILMGHPDTVVLEEQPPLNLVDKAIGGLSALPTLDDEAIADARRQYFQEVAKIHLLPTDAMLIDKSPLFLHKVPLIARLFPDARFILALRHPCDVILSCFMSNFRLNSAMANFLSLDDAAAFYDLTFRHWEHARSLLPIDVRTVVYERLVEDVAGEVRPLFDWLDLGWHEEALDHQQTAKKRGLITTASYSQVIEPIYKRAAGRWERYRMHLEPVLPVLKPWIDRFGYDA